MNRSRNFDAGKPTGGPANGFIVQASPGHEEYQYRISTIGSHIGDGNPGRSRYISALTIGNHVTAEIRRIIKKPTLT